MEQAKTALPLAALAVAVVLYFTGNVPEATAGAVLAGAALILPGPYAGKTLADLSPPGIARILLLACGVVAAAWSVVPVYSALQPGQAKYQGQLTDSAKSVSLGETDAGPYTMTIEGALPEHENSEVTADYKIKLVTGDKSQDIEGQLWRRFDHVRVGRRGTAIQERKRTSEHHPVMLEKGASEVSLVREGSELTTGLHFSLHKVLVPVGIYWIVAVVIFLAGALLEGRYASEKNRSLMTTSLAFSFAFAGIFPDQMSQDAIVKPACGSGIGAGIVAIMAGGIVSWLVRRTLGSKLRSANTPVSAGA